MNGLLRRAGAVWMGVALITVCAGAGIVLITSALYAWLAPLVGPVGAGLLLGAVLLLPAAAFGVWYVLKQRREARLEAARAALAAEESSDLGPLLVAALGLIGALFRARPLATAAVAAAATAVASRHPQRLVSIARRLLPAR